MPRALQSPIRFILAIAALFAALSGCDATGPEPTGNPLFKEQARELGIDFLHGSGEDGQRRMNAIMGAGAATMDFDNDGDLDVFLVQSSGNGGGRLYRNLLIERGELSFTDVTTEVGISSTCYGTGVSAADIDNDRDVDLYVLCYGTNEVWINNGDAGFIERSELLGLDIGGWTAASAWFDINQDGRLDLWVGNYLNYTADLHRECRGPGGVVDYCGPLSYDPLPNRLLLNTPEGFADVTAAWGLATADAAPALGAVVGDFNQDLKTDLYVANDAWPNELWLNQDGRFEEVALLAGVAVSTDGQAEASMGVDAGDFDADGDDDLVMVHLADEKATLYAQGAQGQFTDRTMQSGIGPLTRGFTGFGAAWLDADMDADLDLLIFNGRVRMSASRAGDPFPYSQSPLYLENMGDGRFEDGSEGAGSVFSLRAISRGAAFGDLDNDGDLDVVVNNIDSAPWVLLGQSSRGQPWIGVSMIEHGRAAHGSRAGLLLDNGETIWRRVRLDGSYASANDPRIQFAIPGNVVPVSLEIVWSDGGRETIDADRLPRGRYTRLVRSVDLVQ